MKNKYYANKGVSRNKKPLRNYVYRVSSIIPTEDFPEDLKAKCWVNDRVGYVSVTLSYQGGTLHYQSDLKSLKRDLSVKQWSKLCQGRQTEFIIQRRINKQNIKKHE